MCCFFVVDLSEIPDDKQLTVDIEEEADNVLTAGTVDGVDNKDEGCLIQWKIVLTLTLHKYLCASEIVAKLRKELPRKVGSKDHLHFISNHWTHF